MMFIFLVLPCGDISGGRGDISARRRALHHRLLLDGQGEPREAHDEDREQLVECARRWGAWRTAEDRRGGQERVLHDVMMMVIIIISWW